MTEHTYSPWAHLTELDVLVAFTELPSGNGWYDPQHRVILIDCRLTQAERRCTLAHEIEHVIRGDAGTSCPVLDQRMEYRTHAAAARRLISVPALVDALLWAHDDFQLAEELNVDVETLRMRLATLTDDENRYIDACLWAAEGRLSGDERDRGIA